VNNYKYIFWDFDGVIKESAEIKTQAYYDLFKSYGLVFSEKVKEHHIINSGISRYEKIPIYLEWLGINDELLSQIYCERFSKLVVSAVINCAWVEGAERYLKNNYFSQVFYLISATPQKELEIILNELNIKDVFKIVYGAPIAKSEAIQKILAHDKIDINSSLMIGDALEDYKAAEINKINFLLRRHKLNENIFDSIHVNSISNFADF
jgi:phosphoglycolate phosphatase-like HAD superfamily hydrolase